MASAGADPGPLLRPTPARGVACPLVWRRGAHARPVQSVNVIDVLWFSSSDGMASFLAQSGASIG